MKKYLKIMWAVIKNAYIRDSKIPGFVFVSLITSMLEIVITIVFFDIIFSASESIAGWTFYQVLFLYALAKTITSFHSALTKNGTQAMAHYYVRLGDLDFYLLKPVDSMFLVSVSKPKIYSFVSMFLTIGLGAYALIHSGTNFSFAGMAWFVVLALTTTMLYYYIQVLTIIPTFWLLQAWSLADAINKLQQFMRYPLGIFSKSLQYILTIVFPIMTVAYFPAKVLLFGPKISDIALVILVTIAFILITRYLWRLGERSYSSASS